MPRIIDVATSLHNSLRPVKNALDSDLPIEQKIAIITVQYKHDEDFAKLLGVELKDFSSKMPPIDQLTALKNFYERIEQTTKTILTGPIQQGPSTADMILFKL